MGFQAALVWTLVATLLTGTVTDGFIGTIGGIVGALVGTSATASSISIATDWFSGAIGGVVAALVGTPGTTVSFAIASYGFSGIIGMALVGTLALVRVAKNALKRLKIHRTPPKSADAPKVNKISSNIRGAIPWHNIKNQVI
ncbi:hypothetical protein F0562_022328 [Nyssa sinensis]|uniref:Uncharacterized protein n=1 Tax=Nyssa sinensis TaxID=561372 RepID=A0A5J5BNM8_9ASTE|nr:hypothetical protein F0562_022328 [Nyssa sinensis]